jgi:hypothetical protein
MYLMGVTGSIGKLFTGTQKISATPLPNRTLKQYPEKENAQEEDQDKDANKC